METYSNHAETTQCDPPLPPLPACPFPWQGLTSLLRGLTVRASQSQKHSRVILEQWVESEEKWTGTGSQCWVTSDFRQCKAPAEQLSYRAQTLLTAGMAEKKAQNSPEKSKISDSFFVFAGDEGGLYCPRTEEGDFFLSRVTPLSSITGTPVS